MNMGHNISKITKNFGYVYWRIKIVAGQDFGGGVRKKVVNVV